jgi:hypothetical protein
MVTSASVVNSLAAVFGPIGMFGAAVAVLCAALAMVALARNSVGLAGGAVGVWIVGAMLSVAASFASDWMPLIVSCAALAVGLVLGGVARTLSSAQRSSTA